MPDSLPVSAAKHAVSRMEMEENLNAEKDSPMTYEECAEAGMSQTEAARHLGVSPGAVCRYAARHGVWFRDGREDNWKNLEGRAEAMRKVDPADVARLAEEGYSEDVAAEILGVSRERIRQIKVRDGLDFLSGNVDHDLREQIAALHAEGMTDADIARVTGRHASTVRVNRVALGLPANKAAPYSKWETPIRALAAKGMTVSEVARELDIPQPYVSRDKARFNIPFLRDGRSK